MKRDLQIQQQLFKPFLKVLKQNNFLLIHEVATSKSKMHILPRFGPGYCILTTLIKTKTIHWKSIKQKVIALMDISV